MNPWEQFVGNLSGVWNNLKTKATGFAQTIGNGIKDAWNKFSSWTKEKLPNIGNFIGDTWDELKNGKTNEVNREIADENLAFQRENFDYQKALQERVFEREDTAYQRAVNDMRLAGLNPSSLTSPAGASSPLQTQALDDNFRMSDSSNLAAVSQLLDTVNNLRSQNAQIERTQAETNNINADTAFKNITNNYEEDRLIKLFNDMDVSLGLKKQQKTGAWYDNAIKNIQYNNAARSYNFLLQSGLSENMPDYLVYSALRKGYKPMASTSFSTKGHDPSKEFSTNVGDDGSFFDMVNNETISQNLKEDQLYEGLFSILSGLMPNINIKGLKVFK